MADGQKSTERFDLQEHVPYRPPLPRSPPPKDAEAESADFSDDAWSTGWRALCACINTANHMMIAVVVFYVWRYALSFDTAGTVSKLNLHMIFNATGYHLLMAEGILSLSGNNVWSFVMGRNTRALIHASLQAFGGLFAIIGTSLVISYKGIHFHSAHGICGLIALIFAIISMVGGVVTLFSAKVKLGIKPRPVQLGHKVVGLMTFIMGNVTLALAFDKSVFSAESGDGVATCLIIFTSLVITYASVAPMQSIVILAKTIMAK